MRLQVLPEQLGGVLVNFPIGHLGRYPSSLWSRAAGVEANGDYARNRGCQPKMVSGKISIKGSVPDYFFVSASSNGYLVARASPQVLLSCLVLSNAIYVITDDFP